MAFPIIITFHALGMGFLVGVAIAINGRILGLAPAVPLPRMGAFMPVAWLALTVNAISGVLLLIGYPTKALTNPVFYLKLLCIALALWNLLWFNKTVLTGNPGAAKQPDRKLRTLALVSTLLWAGAILAGRLLAYTYTTFMSI